MCQCCLSYLYTHIYIYIYIYTNIYTRKCYGKFAFSFYFDLLSSFSRYSLLVSDKKEDIVASSSYDYQFFFIWIQIKLSLTLVINLLSSIILLT